ncbi:hypothetical protein C0W92_00715 [Photobacterium angustum]|uniref:YibL family ribosome-associated protein n=2 Tax=Photobacterium angustum TaxID=661 RepID=Q1ZVX0_PHOAS|nr:MULTISPECIES: YibL family ribosome-associated protein [Photobacterium]KJF83268.1 hypothetical protein UB36_01395 [Photobacterium damselae subsp. damselae]EAS65940.1 hypothetical protein VAS14_11524 [Photobacterium angustum S14]KJF93824.1 hypothetical protein UB39_13940 [Photobacterium angustum]KJG03000.1 hypothetical protein UB35_04695 [Photobacterium angustum]KJG08090.1 hypothetical protein UB33_00515 [Photobacterium angustum]
MNLNQELQNLNNRMDKCQRKLAAAIQRDDKVIIKQFKDELTKLNKKAQNVKHRKSSEVSSKSKDVKSLAFNRVLTKAEQADMGKLKKTVKGLVVVHPMTALGRSMGLKEVTGYAPKAF